MARKTVVEKGIASGRLGGQEGIAWRVECVGGSIVYTCVRARETVVEGGVPTGIVCAGRRIASESGWEEERMASESVFVMGLEVERTGEEIVVGNKVVGRRRKEEE